MDLPENKNLIICPFCAALGLKSIFGELISDARGIQVKRGPFSWTISGTKIFISCDTCRNNYVFIFGQGIFLEKPPTAPAELSKFYAITLNTGGTL